MSNETKQRWTTDRKNGRRVLEENGNLVANVAATSGDPPLAFRRAKLIAAAPDLLAAAKAIVANATLQPDQRMSGATDIYAVPLDDIDAARAAIAKAEGKDQ